MESTTPGPLSAAACTFIEKHTEVDLEVSRLDECPICLESYATSSEQSVRIREIVGCSHVLGFNCLKQILCSGPQQRKKCPLCRTQWLAPAPKGNYLPARTHTLESLIRLQAAHSQVVHEAERQIQTTAAPSRSGPAVEASTTTSANIRFPRSIARRSVAEEAAEDEAFRTQLNNYNNFRHDVQDIRTRASGSRSLSRSLRPLNTSSRLSTNLRESEQPGRGSTTTVRSNVPRISSLWGVRRVDSSRDRPEETPARPRLSRDTPRSGTSPHVPELTNISISTGHDLSLHSQERSLTTDASREHNFVQRFGQPRPDPRPSDRSSGATGVAPTYDHDQLAVDLDRHMYGTRVDTTTASRPYQHNETGSEAPNTSTGAVRTSRSRSPLPRSLHQEDEARSTPSHLRVRSYPRDTHDQHVRPDKRTPLHERERRLDTRETLLSSSEAAVHALEQSVRNREQTLAVREREVLSREEQVAGRENNVLAREQRLNVQQQRFEQAMHLVTRHRDEVREMVERQQQELVRVLGGG